MTKDEKKSARAALYRRALGYAVKEENEEYAPAPDGGWELTKRKVSTREVPPELAAIKALLDGEPPTEPEPTEEELIKERERLLGELGELTKNEKRSIKKQEIDF